MPQNYVLLQRIELNASAGSVDFTNIPTTGYTDLKIVWSARTSNSNLFGYGYVYFNGSQTSYTAARVIEGTGSGVSSYTQATTYGFNDDSVGNTSTANTFGNSELYIPNYNSSNNKSFSVDIVGENNGTTAYSQLIAGLWSNSAAINRVTFSTSATSLAGGTPQYMAGSTFSLYGLAAVGTTPAIAPKASGGSITSDGTYWIHTFRATDTFTPFTNLSCDALVVAGGGGGGADYGSGGGGAGGFRTSTGLSVTAQAYTITVGAGGAGATSNSQLPSSGSNSVFSTITSAGGGRAGAIYGSDKNGAAGGSGGGGAGQGQGGTGGAGNTPSVSPSQGNNGGTTSGIEGGAGGGGAGSVGTGNTGNTGGNGGSGTSNSYSGSAVTYAGGGAGSSYPSGGGTASGGGGSAGNNGTANTGGGGGAANAGTDNLGKAGGSGIVIIRYTIA